VAEPPGMHSQAEPGNEIVSIISTPYRDVYNDKGRAWERAIDFGC